MSTRRPLPRGLEQLEELLDRPGQLRVRVRLVGTLAGTAGRAGLGLPVRNRLAKRARGVRVDIGERQVANPIRVSVMLVSCGDSVQPAAEADQRASGAEDVAGAVQQPPPAAQRPR